jgi:hypothetical protein
MDKRTVARVLLACERAKKSAERKTGNGNSIGCIQCFIPYGAMAVAACEIMNKKSFSVRALLNTKNGNSLEKHKLIERARVNRNCF